MEEEKKERVLQIKKQQGKGKLRAPNTKKDRLINQNPASKTKKRAKIQETMQETQVNFKSKGLHKQSRNLTASTSKKKKKKKLTPEQIQQRKKQKRRATRVEIIKFMLPVMIAAVIVFFFILKTSPHMVDGDSMSPTLVNKDRVIVRRTKKLKRYEIITFKPPVDSKFQYVKRIIGMPGDMIWMEDNDLFINHQSKELPDASDRSSATALPDGTIKVNVSDTCAEQLKNLDKIPEGHYFVLGDNRNNSSDSRTFGLVDGQAVEGVVSFRYTPLNQAGFIK